MMIVSQSRSNIVNYENIKLIGTDRDGVIQARLAENDSVLLGRYGSLKRAQKVLQEMTEFYRSKKFFDDDGKTTPEEALSISLCKKVFTMPKE